MNLYNMTNIELIDYIVIDLHKQQDCIRKHINELQEKMRLIEDNIEEVLDQKCNLTFLRGSRLP